MADPGMGSRWGCLGWSSALAVSCLGVSSAGGGVRGNSRWGVSLGWGCLRRGSLRHSKEGPRVVLPCLALPLDGSALLVGLVPLFVDGWSWLDIG